MIWLGVRGPRWSGVRKGGLWPFVGRASGLAPRVGAIALSLLWLLAVGPAPAAAYTQNVWVASFNTFETKCGWCVVASSITWLKYIQGSTIPSEATMASYMSSKDRYPRQSGSCIDPSDGVRYYGHDPRGWAWGMYNYSPAGWYFNDYKDSSQSYMDWEFVYGIRADGNPVGAIVMAGYHAIDLVGYSTLNDPFSELAKQLNGFYLFDPWYGRGNSGITGWPYNGFAPDSYVTISDWNTKYYMKDLHDGPNPNIWYNLYDGVLRSTTGAPSDTPPETYGDYGLNGYAPGGAPAPDPGSGSMAIGVGDVSIDDAITAGLSENGLGSGTRLGLDLTGFSMGSVVHVDSIVAELPSYDFVELRVHGRLEALAVVNEVAGRYQFGALTAVATDPAFMTAGGRSAALLARGLSGSGRLVGGPTTDGATPMQPFLTGTDPTTGRPTFLGASGRLGAIEVLPGFSDARG